MKQKVQQENMVEKLNKIILTSIVFESTGLLLSTHKIDNYVRIKDKNKNQGHLLNIYKCEYCQIDEQEIWSIELTWLITIFLIFH
jgi:hypothetical protein